MEQYQIAGINITVTWENEQEKRRQYRFHDCIILPRVLEAFRADGRGKRVDIEVFVQEMRSYMGAKEWEQIGNQKFYQTSDSMIMVIGNPFCPNQPGYSITMKEDYSRLIYTPHISEYQHGDLQWMMYGFEGRILYCGGVVLHGAAIECNGRGLIFTGVSGAGKSTQAHLWQKYRDAWIINGDCPAIRMADGMVKVYGTPWCGTSGEAINRSVLLHAIILVKQGEKNAVRRLEGNAAFLAVLSNVLRSNFDEKALDLSIQNLSSIIQKVRVYEFICTVEEEAVDALENALEEY